MNQATDDDIGVRRGILIDPENRQVRSVMVPKGESIANVIGCELITRVVVSEGTGRWAGHGDDLWLDDEGLLTEPNKYGYFRLRSAAYPGNATAMFAGRGLILGYDDEGESRSTRLTVADVFPTVEWIAYADANPEELEPAITLHPLDDNLQPIPGAETVLRPARKS